MDILRPSNDYEGNPVGLNKDTCVKLSKDLNKHLATYVVMYMQYHKHHWNVVGPQFRDLHMFLEKHYKEVNKDLDTIAERITLLGCIPASRLDTYQKNSYVDQEPEDVMHIRDSLQHIMDNETKICNQLRKTIEMAMEKGDYGTKMMLEGMLFRAEDRAHHLEHFLGEDSLSVGMLHKPAELAEA